MLGSRKFSRNTMIQVGDSAVGQMGRRLVRFPLVLLLAIGLLASLIHCAGCGPGLAGADASAAVTSLDRSAPEVPEQALPCHSGHCLSHVAAQPAATTATPADLVARAPWSVREQSPASHAGLPLFKPPRA